MGQEGITSYRNVDILLPDYTGFHKTVSFTDRATITSNIKYAHAELDLYLAVATWHSCIRGSFYRANRLQQSMQAAGATTLLKGQPTVASLEAAGATTLLKGQPTVASLQAAGATALIQGQPTVASLQAAGATALLQGQPTVASLQAAGTTALLQGQPTVASLQAAGATAVLPQHAETRLKHH